MDPARNKIMIVDDEQGLTDILALNLEKRGYQVFKAYDGQQALDLLKENEPDLIVLDLTMPVMGGIPFYEAVCDENGIPSCPIFVHSARTQMQNVFAKFNIAGFLPKPVELNELTTKIEHTLERVKNRYSWIKPKEIENKVILVENNDEEAKKIEKVLVGGGYDVIRFTKGFDAIEYTLNHDFDVILVKLGLEDLSGEDVILRLISMLRITNSYTFLYRKFDSDHSIEITGVVKNKTGFDKFIEYHKPEEILNAIQETIAEIADA